MTGPRVGAFLLDVTPDLMRSRIRAGRHNRGATRRLFIHQFVLSGSKLRVSQG